MDKLLPFDQLNKLSAELRETFAVGMQKKEREDIMDSVLDILIIAYVFGNEAANTMLETDKPIDRHELEFAVTKEVAGETWVDRVSKYIEEGTADDIIRVAETDAHRIYNEAIYNVGASVQEEEIANGVEQPIYKTWETMRDDRVRDTHDVLEGTKIPFNQKFYTYSGASAFRPGEFGVPEEDIGCRCRLRLSRS